MGWTLVGTIGGNSSSSSGGGGSGAQGPPGAAGTKFLLGNEPPTLAQGNVGDLFFQSAPFGGGAILIPGPIGPPGLPGVSVIGPPGANVGSDGGLFTPPSNSQWTATLNNSSTATFGTNNIYLHSPANANSKPSYVLTKVPVAPYTANFYMYGFLPAVNFYSFGALWFDTVNSKFKFIGQTFSTAVGVEVGASTDGNLTFTTVSDYIFVSPMTKLYNWLQLKDSGTTQTFSISSDGVNWIPIFSHATNTDVTANMIGFYMKTQTSTGTSESDVALWSYSVSHP
jgi:hypothetical protein